MLTVPRTHDFALSGAAAAAQTLPVKIAYLSKTLVGGSAVGTVSASLAISDAATSTATPQTPTDAVTLTAAAVASEIVVARAILPGDISAWQ
jgi:hypothetical protein